MDFKAPRWGDIAIAAALLALSLLALQASVLVGVDTARLLDVGGYALLAAQVVPLAWRQRYPRAVAWLILAAWAAYVGIGYVETPGSFALYISLYGVAAYLPRRIALRHGIVLAVLMMAWTAVGVLATDFVPWTALIAMALAAVVPLMLGFADFRRRERLTELELAHERRERAQRVVAADAVRAERARIARELHDVVAHEITVMTLQAEGARRLAKDGDERVLEALATISDSGRKGLAEMQRMIGVLRASEQDATESAEHDRALAGAEPGDDLAPMPSLAALPALAQQVEDAGLPVELTVAGSAHVPAGVELSAYRIVQEALTNAMKHAGPGATARVAVERRATRVEIVVEDDGRGAISEAARTSGGHGLRGMRERVQALGGELDFGPRRGGGFRVRASLPSGDDQVAARGLRMTGGTR